MMDAQVNWLDRAITWVAPRIGLRRVRARAAALALLSYDGAKTGRRADGWIATGSSADAEIGPALSKLRERSRDLVRNNPYAARAVDEWTQQAVGTGIVAKAKQQDPELNKRVDRAWEQWCEECDADGALDFYGLQALVVRTVTESGECLIRKRARRPEDGLTVPLQLQVIEPDYLDSGKTEVTQFGHRITQGIEYDLLGRRAAYWLFPNHPGDTLNVKASSFLSKRIPADAVIHIYEKKRPGQSRGIPRAVAVMLKLRDLDDYEEAELVRKKIEACFAAFVTQPEGADGAVLAPSTSDAAGRRIETFEPGMIEYLKAGEAITFHTPQNAGGYREYLSTQQRAIAAGFGLTFEQLTGDLSQVNYSSYRAGLISFRTGMEQYRWLVLATMFLRQVRRAFLDELAVATPLGAKLSEAADKEGYLTEWTFPKFGTVDPLKDAAATLMDIRMGRLTWSQAVGESGYDPAEQLDEIERINAEFDRRAIVLDCDPRKVTKTGIQQKEEEEEPGGAKGKDANAAMNGHVNGHG